MSSLLCIDFDFFFPNPLEAGADDAKALGLYEWGHSEHLGGLYLSPVVWATRAHGFVRMQEPLPMVNVPDGGWSAFWDRFTFATDAEMRFADSNAHTGLFAPPDGSEAFDKIVLFDAHHDSGYNLISFEEFQARGSFSCEDWMLVHQQRGVRDLQVRYPTWKPNGPSEDLPEGVLTQQVVDDGLPLDGIEFDAVFVCRSGAWVPPWCDREFTALLDACPLWGMQVDDEELDRKFTVEDALAAAQAFEAAISQVPST